ncbi:MAG: TonB-dependent receptor domain-containing protein [Steroidobacteraceae bacterium]
MSDVMCPRASTRAAIFALSSVFSACGAISPRVAASQESLSRGPQSPDVLVTASRQTESLDEALWSADVLTRSDIEASQALSFQSLLAELPGVQYDNTGGLGKQASLFMRGMNSTQTLLLVDGMRVGSATTGLPPIELIPVDEIERIEVVRGPRSTLYGSDAMGGVIQIFTRGSEQSGFAADGSVTGGTYSTFNEALSFRGGLGPVWFGASGQVLHTAGFEACSAPAQPGQPPTDCFGNPAARDGYLNRSDSFTAGVRLGEGWTAAFNSLVTSGHTDYDSAYGGPDSTEFAERVSALHIDGRITEHWSLHAMGGRDVDDAHDFLAGADVDRFGTVRNLASLQVDGTILSALSIVTGADWYGDHVGAYQVSDGVIAPVLFGRTTRDTTGTFIELHGSTGAVSELAGVRYERNTQFGDHVTEDLGAGWQVSRRYRLTATWGTAFHAPTFNDLYYPTPAGSAPFSNPGLDPESSRTLELGLEAHWDDVRWSLHAFQTDVHDLITYLPPDYTPINLDRARIRGIELEGSWRHGPWTLSGQVTGLDPVDRSPTVADAPATYGNLLPRRARSSAFLEIRRTLWQRASLSARGRWEGRRFDDIANTVPLGGYFLLDVLADAEVGHGWSLEARIANALGRTYYTAAAIDDPTSPAYYNQPGRELDLTVRYRFQHP